MKRKDYLQNPVKHIKIGGTLTVDELMRQFKNSGSVAIVTATIHMITPAGFFVQLVMRKTKTL